MLSYFTLDINECRNNPCQNGASCTNRFGGYHCACAQGFEENSVIKVRYVFYKPVYSTL